MEDTLRPERELPTTEGELFATSSSILTMRGNGMSWKEVSLATGYTRCQSIRLAHSIFELVSAHADTARHEHLNRHTA